MLDSFAVLAFLFREKGHEKVLARLETAAEEGDTLLVAAPNWAEVRYMVERMAGTARWAETRQRLLGLPLEVVAADQALAEQAGGIKAVSRMSLADCFAAALAKLKGSEVYTGDPEFKAVEREIRIVWL